MLGLPLPWQRIGRAVASDPVARDRPRRGPAPRTRSAWPPGSTRPVAHLDALGRARVRLRGRRHDHARGPRREPEAADRRATAARRSMVNAMGLPNPGAEAVADHLRRHPGAPAPRFVSLADEALDDAVSALELLEPLVDGVELNASCPNVSWGRDRDNETHLRELVTAFRARTDQSPVREAAAVRDHDVEREVVLALATIAVEAGADGLTCSQHAARRRRRGSRWGAVGVSGRALWPSTRPRSSPRCVRPSAPGSADQRLRRRRRRPTTSLACLEAGATTVQVYTSARLRGSRDRRGPDGRARAAVAPPGPGGGRSEPGRRPALVAARSTCVAVLGFPGHDRRVHRPGSPIDR